MASNRYENAEEIKKTLANIPPEFFKEEFNPFTFFRNPELGNWDYDREDAVDAIVEVSHKDFNTSTSSFSNIVKLYDEAQSAIPELRANLELSKRILSSQNENLKELWFKAKVYQKILHILVKVEYLQSVPAQIELFKSRRQHMHAMHLIQHTIEQLMQPDVCSIEGDLSLISHITSYIFRPQSSSFTLYHTYIKCSCLLIF